MLRIYFLVIPFMFSITSQAEVSAESVCAGIKVMNIKDQKNLQSLTEGYGKSCVDYLNKKNADDSPGEIDDEKEKDCKIFDCLRGVSK